MSHSYDPTRPGITEAPDPDSGENVATLYLVPAQVVFLAPDPEHGTLLGLSNGLHYFIPESPRSLALKLGLRAIGVNPTHAVNAMGKVPLTEGRPPERVVPDPVQPVAVQVAPSRERARPPERISVDDSDTMCRCLDRWDSGDRDERDIWRLRSFARRYLTGDLRGPMPGRLALWLADDMGALIEHVALRAGPGGGPI